MIPPHLGPTARFFQNNSQRFLRFEAIPVVFQRGSDGIHGKSVVTKTKNTIVLFSWELNCFFGDLSSGYD
jgi:hypothetical protein